MHKELWTPDPSTACAGTIHTRYNDIYYIITHDPHQIIMGPQHNLRYAIARRPITALKQKHMPIAMAEDIPQTLLQHHLAQTLTMELT